MEPKKTFYERLNDYATQQSFEAYSEVGLAAGAGYAASRAVEEGYYGLCGVLGALTLFLIGSAISRVHNARKARFRRDVELNQKPGGLEQSIEED